MYKLAIEWKDRKNARVLKPAMEQLLSSVPGSSEADISTSEDFDVLTKTKLLVMTLGVE